MCYPAIITMFYTSGVQGFSYSYMPYELNVYLLTTLFVLISGNYINDSHKSLWLPPILVAFTSYVFLVDLIFGSAYGNAELLNNNLYSLLLILMFQSMLNKNQESALRLFPLCFAITSLYFSYIFFTHLSQFASFYGDSGLVRSGWKDPNYLGMMIGMGTLSSLMFVFNKYTKGLSVLEKIIYISAIVFSVPTLVMMASRGALLSLLIASSIMIISSHAKTYYKILLLIVAFIGLYWLYNNNFFELLIYRMQNDDGTGSNRTLIWTQKLNLFIQGNPIHWFFGYGFYGGTNIAGFNDSFHNDFIGTLVEYGIFGFTMLLYMLYYPFRITKRKTTTRLNVVVLLVYLLTCMMTLEPIGLGVLTFYVFYLYIILVAKQKYQEISDKPI